MMKDCEIIHFVANAFDTAWNLVKSEMRCVKCGEPTEEVIQCTECGDNWCPDCYEAFSPQWFHIDGDNLAGTDNVDACPKHGPDFKGVG